MLENTWAVARVPGQATRCLRKGTKPDSEGARRHKHREAVQARRLAAQVPPAFQSVQHGDCDKRQRNRVFCGDRGDNSLGHLSGGAAQSFWIHGIL